MQRAIDGKEALQRQLHAAKSSGSSAGGGDQNVLSLMIQVDEYKNKASNTFFFCGLPFRVSTAFVLILTCLRSWPSMKRRVVTRRRAKNMPNF